MKFKSYIKICKIWTITMLILCFAGYFISPLRSVFTVVMLSLIIIGLILFLVYSKCPLCKRSIPLNRIFFVSHCPHCSKNLYD